MFGIERRRRGELLEAGARFLRRGLDEGELPDGPGGSLIPISPRPIQAHVPILFGGWVAAAIDRAVRLGDGYLGSDPAHPEVNIPEHYATVVAPALARHGRSPDDFRYVVTAPIWVTDDPEGDWHGDFGEAFRYQQRQYIRALDDPTRDLAGSSTDFDAGRVMIGTRRLIAMRSRAPWHEFAFYHRLPGLSHARAMEHLERVTSQLLPALRSASLA